MVGKHEMADTHPVNGAELVLFIQAFARCNVDGSKLKVTSRRFAAAQVPRLVLTCENFERHEVTVNLGSNIKLRPDFPFHNLEQGTIMMRALLSRQHGPDVVKATAHCGNGAITMEQWNRFLIEVYPLVKECVDEAVAVTLAIAFEGVDDLELGGRKMAIVRADGRWHTRGHQSQAGTANMTIRPNQPRRGILPVRTSIPFFANEWIENEDVE